MATVAPLLPIEAPGQFFSDLAERFDAIVIDHFIGGDGSAEGGRTRRTGLPVVMEAVNPQSTQIAYRDAMVAVARGRCARVGVGCDGFAGRYIA